MDDGVAFLSFIHKFGSLYYAPFSLPMPAGLFWSPAFHFRRLSSRTLAPDPSCILLVRPCHLDMENKATSRESIHSQQRRQTDGNNGEWNRSQEIFLVAVKHTWWVVGSSLSIDRKLSHGHGL